MAEARRKRTRTTMRNQILIPTIIKRISASNDGCLRSPAQVNQSRRWLMTTNSIDVTNTTMEMVNGCVIKLKITMIRKSDQPQRRMARRKMTVMRQIKLIRSRKSRQRSRVMMEALPRQKAVIAT